MISFIQKNLYTCFVIYIVNIIELRLLQVADYICTLELSKLRWDENRETKSERGFFGTRQIFMKNYYRKIQKKHIGK